MPQTDLTVPRPHQGGFLCPACKVNLVMTDRQGIEIDYCPNCRGVWLDRGELDKIIERNMQDGAAQQPRFAPVPQQPVAQQPYYGGGGHNGGHHENRGHHGSRNHSFLGRLFD
ncbi:MAG: recombination protein RecR [Cereibacter sphaeroides]|uniref:Recombination protein RecR n=1 Tax=Cereibacter sphaeroides TaxID=1063 RepID=A0A2W5SC90_CERSP|nr:MAG: recombination protein RecR [Cereibacter sphaeroides]